jgi:hypothetical protein
LFEGVSHERARCLTAFQRSENVIEGGEGKYVDLGGGVISKT